MKRAALTVTLLLLSCARDLREDFPFDGESGDGPLVSAEVDGDVTRLFIDATSKSGRVYVDLDEGRELKSGEALDSNGWELALQRMDISINSGTSNPEGTVVAQVLPDSGWASLTQAPASGYREDTGGRLFNTDHDGWYEYDLNVHRLTRRPLMYVLRTSEGAYVKLKILSYYDTAGTPAVLTVEYAALSPP